MFIKMFEPGTADPNRNWLIIGARNTGKSVLLRDLLYHQRNNIDVLMAMTATVTTANMLKELTVSEFVCEDGYNPESATRFLETSIKLVKNSRLSNRNTGLVQDDCMFDSKIQKGKVQSQLAMNGRHYKTAQFGTTQYSMLVPVQIRSNIDYVFALSDPIRANRKRLFDHFYGCFETFAEFEKVFKHCTRNYGALVLDRTQSSGELCDTIKMYRATPNIPKFTVTNPVYWSIMKKIKAAKENKRQHSSPGQLVDL
jgi:hypothetical protein